MWANGCWKIEIFIMDLSGNILDHIPNYTDYIVPQSNTHGALTNEIDLDPKNILIERGYASGQYNLHVNIKKGKYLMKKDLLLE